MAFEIENGVLKKYIEEDGVTEVTIPDCVKFIGIEAFLFCENLTGITIPDSVTVIGNNAFQYCQSLADITIPDSVIGIGSGAFANCEKLTSITIPYGVEFIGSNTFKYCQSLADITIPDSVTKIGDSAFYYCQSLTGITIPGSVTKIGGSVFQYCTGLTSITIPDSVTSIGDCAFSFTNITGITISDSVTEIGNNAFSDCESLISIDVSGGNKKYCSCNGILYNKDMTEIIKYPAKKKSAEFIVPESVKNIASTAFYDCIHLERIEFSDNITNIGKRAFYTGMKIIICKDDIKVMFTLKGVWTSKIPELVLNDFMAADIDNRQKYFGNLKYYYKVPFAIFMILAYPQESGYYLDYLENNTEEAGRYLTDEENIDLLYRFLELGFVTEDNIDSLISYAVSHTQNGGSPECQLILSKYKSDNFGTNDTDTFDKFML